VLPETAQPHQANICRDSCHKLFDFLPAKQLTLCQLWWPSAKTSTSPCKKQPCMPLDLTVSLRRYAVKTRRIIVISVIVPLIAIAGLLISLPERKAPAALKVGGSLFDNDVRAIRNQIGRIHRRIMFASLWRCDFREFGRRASENFRLHLVSIEGDKAQATATYKDDSNRETAIYYFTNTGGIWSLRQLATTTFNLPPRVKISNTAGDH
jgi:hypothetical protein